MNVTEAMKVLQGNTDNKAVLFLQRATGKQQYLDAINVIKKELKALEIIRREPFTVAEVMDDCETWEDLLWELDGNLGNYFPIKSKEEFDLLKEVLNG